MIAKPNIRFTAAVLLVSLLLGAAGCGPARQTADTVTVTDQLGREVEVPREPQRLVSGYYISTSMIMALGATDRLVGIELKADSRPLYGLAAPQILDLPQVSSSKAFNMEAVLELEPDLVVLPARMKDTVEQLEQLGLAVIAIEPEDLQSLEDSFILLGRALGLEDRAEALSHFYQDKLEQARELASAVTERKRVYLAGSDLLRTCSQEMYQHSVIELAGGLDVAGDITTGYWVNVSMEQVLAWDPEVVLLAEYNEAQTAELQNDEKWQGVTAVRDGAIYRFPSEIEPWDSPGPAAVLGILWLSHTLTPSAYSLAELNEDVDFFYSHFHGIELPAASGL